MQMLDSRSGGGMGGGMGGGTGGGGMDNDYDYPEASAGGAPSPGQAATGGASGGQDPYDDDIPF
jgi:single-strand DNA-binding protein